MLEITVPDIEQFDEETNEFITIKGQTLRLEHSLVSLSKWESKWQKPFLADGNKTTEEVIDYIRCMTITQNVDPRIYARMPGECYSKINSYIANPMTATIINEPPGKKSELPTSELIYYWMVAFNIPFRECEKWHLNRLLTLIRICNIKNDPNPKKMSTNEILARNKAINDARRKAASRKVK